MKAMVLKEYNQPLVYCEDYPDPVIREENDVIIKITACGSLHDGSQGSARRAGDRRTAADPRP